jgi:hypothetical protein
MQLRESTDAYTHLPTNVTGLGSSKLKNHLAWILKHPDAASSKNINMELYDFQEWESISDGANFPMSSPMGLIVYNNEPHAVFLYIFWRDREWHNYFSKPICVRISEHASFTDSVIISEPLGHQDVVCICSRQLIPNKIIEDLINGKAKAVYDARTSNMVGFDHVHFNLIR